MAARAPIALSRLCYERGSQEVVYTYTSAYDHREQTERIGVGEFIARLATHIPEHHERLIRYYGHYASRARGARRAGAVDGETGSLPEKAPAHPLEAAVAAAPAAGLSCGALLPDLWSGR